MAPPNPSGQNQHLAIFRVASYVFCAPARSISAITDVPAWTRIPKAPPSILGAVNHRGQVVVVVSLRRKLGLAPRSASDRDQLIITELATGLMGFMVDEVEDVRLPVDMQRHPLAADAAIDIFDAYLVDDERILLQTTFQKLYDARETPPRHKDLEADLRQAEKQLTATAASTAAADTPAAAKPSAAASPRAPGPAPAAAKTPTAVPAVKAEIHGPPPATGALPPAGNDLRPKSRPPAAEDETPTEMAWSGGMRPGMDRPPWYRYGLVATLLLVMTVALGAGVWLLRQQSGMPPPGIGPMDARPEAGEPEPARQPIQKPPAPEPATKPTAASEIPPAPQRKAAAAPPAAPETTAAPSTRTAERSTEPAVSPEEARGSEVSAPQATADQPAAPPAEVLRVEAETFTLTVERPGNDRTIGPGPASGEAPPEAAEEIRHIVVRGDTLWDIAAHYLGDPLQYAELARLSRIQNPDLIYPDDVIRIVRRPSAPGPDQP